MDTIRLGNHGLQVSRLGLGCMGMSEFYGATNEAESIETLHKALELGVTFLDTADAYGPWENEKLLAKALKGKRDQVTLATKFGLIRSADPQTRAISGKPDYVREACDASLKRLEVDSIDLYYQHRVDPATPIEDTVGAMARLVEAGKVKYLGLSEASPETLARACKVHPISALQTEYSLWSRDPEDGLLKACEDLGIGFVAYSPLGRGFLTGSITSFDDLAPDDYRRFSPRFQGDNFQKNLDVVRKVGEFAAKKGCTVSQLALAWVLANPIGAVPIPGTKRRKYLVENVGALEIKLTQAEIQELNDACPSGSASGTRYPEAMMSLVNG